MSHLGSSIGRGGELAELGRASLRTVGKPDQKVSHRRVVRVMDQARAFGLTRLAIATEANSGDDVAP